MESVCVRREAPGADIVRVAAPVYLKFGLRGTTDPYPAGSHLEATLIALSRERVRRARLGLDQLERLSGETGAFMSSRPGASGLAVPVAKGEAAPLTGLTGDLRQDQHERRAAARPVLDRQ